MIKLGVNIDHIATLRQARKESFPSPVKAVSICEKAGADSITTHLREDRRHIQDRDVFEIKEIMRTKLNFEMAACEEIVNIALKLQPYSVCIVPEKRQEITTEGGLDVIGQKNYLSEIVQKLQKKGIIVSMFIDPHPAQIQACADIKADAIEIHTGKYANLFKSGGKQNALPELEKIKQLNADSAELIIDNTSLSPFVFIDQEGGRVRRIKDGITYLPAAKKMGEMSSEEVHELARSAAEDMKNLGISASLSLH